jgi:hypothetical protein
MSQDQVNTSNYGSDDYSGYYPHKFSISSREHSRFGPSLNPDIFSQNPDLPPYPPDYAPPHLSKFRPTVPEPNEDVLLCAKQQATECSAIKNNLGIEWLGIDYSDPNAAYNCFCSSSETIPNNSWWSTKGHLTESDYGLGSGVSDHGRLAKLPSEIQVQQIYNPPSYDIGDCGKEFEKYIEYSKTNATFWNTPPKTPLYRRAQMALLMYNRIKILVHGDFNIKPGDLINISYSLNMQNNTEIKKTRHDGRWMVYKIQRILTPIKHSMFLHLMRDGSEVNPTQYRKVNIEK